MMQYILIYERLSNFGFKYLLYYTFNTIHIIKCPNTTLLKSCLIPLIINEKSFQKYTFIESVIHFFYV